MFFFLNFNIYSFPANDFFASMYNLSQNINKYHIEFPEDPSESKPRIKKLIKDHFKLSGDGYVYKSVLKFRSFKDEFVEGVAKLKYSTKDNFLLKIIFNDINMKVFGGQKLDYNRNTFEHYLPQNPSEWKINRDIAANHCHKIGNLLFLDKNLNSHLQNFKHKIKLKALKDNPNLTDAFTKEFINVHDLGNPEFDFNKIDENHLKNSDFYDNPSEIDKRTKSIANCLWNIYINDFKYKVY